MNYLLKDILPLIQIHGRTCQHNDTLWFDWTCAGFTVRFTGTTLTAKIRSIGVIDINDRERKRMEYSCIGVVGPDGESLVYRTECVDAEKWYTLFEAEQPGTYTLRVVKLSENARGKTGVCEIETDGTLEPVPFEKKKTIEFIGDSITCGYGDESKAMMDPFKTSEENGWIAYGPLAARKLGLEFSMVCVSGIGVTAGTRNFTFPGYIPMEKGYPYTDPYYDNEVKRPQQLWDFAAHPTDIIVLNLGTNDRSAVAFAQTLEAAEVENEFFRVHYRKFLEDLRRLNGPDTLICCMLGPMDFYLADEIRMIVDAYQKETGDTKIRFGKFRGVNMMTEGHGSAGHPTAKTQARMAEELVHYLNLWTKED